jgi:hypothetical protein
LLKRSRNAHWDFVEADAQVVALEGFRPMPIGHEVERGRFYKLTDAVVRQHPTHFAGHSINVTVTEAGWPFNHAAY